MNVNKKLIILLMLFAGPKLFAMVPPINQVRQSIAASLESSLWCVQAISDPHEGSLNNGGIVHRNIPYRVLALSDTIKPELGRIYRGDHIPCISLKISENALAVLVKYLRIIDKELNANTAVWEISWKLVPLFLEDKFGHARAQDLREFVSAAKAYEFKPLIKAFDLFAQKTLKQSLWVIKSSTDPHETPEVEGVNIHTKIPYSVLALSPAVKSVMEQSYSFDSLPLVWLKIDKNALGMLVKYLRFIAERMEQNKAIYLIAEEMVTPLINDSVTNRADCLSFVTAVNTYKFAPFGYAFELSHKKFALKNEHIKLSKVNCELLEQEQKLKVLLEEMENNRKIAAKSQDTIGKIQGELFEKVKKERSEFKQAGEQRLNALDAAIKELQEKRGSLIQSKEITDPRHPPFDVTHGEVHIQEHDQSEYIPGTPSLPFTPFQVDLDEPEGEKLGSKRKRLSDKIENDSPKKSKYQVCCPHCGSTLDTEKGLEEHISFLHPDDMNEFEELADPLNNW